MSLDLFPSEFLQLSKIVSILDEHKYADASDDSSVSFTVSNAVMRQLFSLYSDYVLNSNRYLKLEEEREELLKLFRSEKVEHNKRVNADVVQFDIEIMEQKERIDKARKTFASLKGKSKEKQGERVIIRKNTLRS